MQRIRRWVRRHTAVATATAVAGIIVTIMSVVASGMIWNSLTAETRQRKRAESLLDKSEGLRLIVSSALVKDENPGLALLLALKGAQHNPGVDANSALLNAFGSSQSANVFARRTVFWFV